MLALPAWCGYGCGYEGPLSHVALRFDWSAEALRAKVLIAAGEVDFDLEDVSAWHDDDPNRSNFRVTIRVRVCVYLDRAIICCMWNMGASFPATLI